MTRKPSRGRQKIKIEKIDDKSPLQVTFSKRRSGMFKKASELYIQFGLQVAIIVLSPAGKVFSYGNSHLDSIADKFFDRKPAPHPHRVVQETEARGTLNITRNVETEGGTLDITRNSETERDKFEEDNTRKGEGKEGVVDKTWSITISMKTETKRMETEGQNNTSDSRKEELSENLWERPIDELEVNQLEKLMEAMKELKMNVLEELKR